MKNIFKLLVAVICFGCGGGNLHAKSNIVDLRKKSKELKELKETLQTGDLIFQYTNTRVARVTEAITKSPITHVGIVIVENKKVRVLEASSKVKYTSLKSFLLKSKNGWVAVRKPAKELTEKQMESLRLEAKKWIGKPYDSQFSWGDDKIYCTELVYKMYENIGLKISALEKVSVILEDNEDNVMLNKYIKKVYGSKHKIKKRDINNNIQYFTL